MGIVSRIHSRNASRTVRVERDALRYLLDEVHDLRARQGVDWRWVDTLPPRLRAQAQTALIAATPR